MQAWMKKILPEILFLRRRMLPKPHRSRTGTFYDITNIKFDRKAGIPLIRESPTGALPEEEGQLRTHLPVSSNLPSSAENASGGTGKTSEKINGGTDEYGDDVRSSLINLELTEDERSLVNIMKVLISGQFDPDFDYAQRVKDVYGLGGSAEDAKFAAMVALREKKADAQRAAREKAYAYFRSNNPLFEFIDDFAGGFHDFHIVPVNGKGEKFTGTFIAPEYVKWSEKRPQGKNESDKRYQNYLQKREEALKKAKGYDSADLAERDCITICSGNSRVCDINFILTGSGIRRWSSLIVLFFRDAGTGEGAFSTAVLRDGNDARDLVRQIGNMADHAHQLAAAVEFG